MKKVLALTAAIAASFAFPLIDSQAGETCRSRIHSRCGHCGHHVLSYYRPIRTVATRSIYGWVPAYHSNCGVKLHGSVYGHRHVHGNSGLRHSLGVPNSHNFGYGKGVVRRSVPAAGVHRHSLSSRTISTYPGYRISKLRTCR